MSDPIDMNVFRDLQANAGADFVDELVGTFLDEAPAMLAALRDARNAGNADAYRRAAHSLKSNGLTFGAAALAARARAIELGGMNAQASVDHAAIDALAAAYAEAAQALRGLRDA